MSNVPESFKRAYRFARVALIVVLLGGVVLSVLGVLLMGDLGAAMALSFKAGMITLAVALVIMALAVVAFGMLVLFLKIESNAWRSLAVLRDINALLERHEKHLGVIAENVQLSEVARSLSHRKVERNALRRAINEEIARGDWEAAYALVEQLEARHGYKNEASRLRSELDTSRDIDLDHKLQDGIQLFKGHLVAMDWDRARREMDKLLSRYGHHFEVEELPRMFARARDEQKRTLLKQWDETVQRNEIDRGIQLLRQLDQYLTPSEAAALEDSARGVFRAKLHNLGVQFSLAVTDNEWEEALKIGRQIVNEYPNSRMAEEVGERMQTLAHRAAKESSSRVPADVSSA